MTADEQRERQQALALLRMPLPRRRARLVGTGMDPALLAGLERCASEAIGRSPRQALRIADLLSDAAEQAASVRAGAVSDHVRARVHHRAGRYALASRLYARAAAAFARMGLGRDANRVRMHLVDALVHLGDLAGAEREARRARAGFERDADPVGTAKVLCNLANLRHAQDRHREAIALFESARPALAAGGQCLDLAHVDMNLANSWSQLARFDRSGPLYVRARLAYDALEQPVWAAQVDYNDAYDHFLQGRLAEARPLLARARQAFRREGAVHHLALAALDESEMALSVNLAAEAEEAAREARRAFRAGGEAIQAARADLLAAQAARLAGDDPRSRRWLSAARAAFARAGHGPGMAACDLAAAAAPACPPPRRRALALGAAATFARAGMAGRQAVALVVAGTGAVEMGRSREGRRLLVRALDTARRRHLAEVELRAEHALGRVAEDDGRRSAALVRYRRAIAAYERLRAGLRSDEDRLGFAVDKSVVFADAMRAALDLGRIGEAFDLVERARSRALADLLAGDARFAGSSLRFTPALARRMGNLKREILALETRVRERERRAEAVPAALAARIRHALTARERTMDRLARAEPEATYALAGWPVLPLDGVRALLGAGRALVAYFAEGEHLGAIAVTDQEVVVRRGMTTRGAVERDLQALRFALTQARLDAGPGRLRSLAAGADEILASLRVRLIEPLAPVFADRALVVVPHAVLQLVPFHALMRGGRALIEEREVTTAPSATVLARALGRRPRTTGALVVAAPDAAAPVIAHEARVVADRLGGRLLEGPDATAAALHREAPRARIVHLAAHGVYETGEPLLSGLNLADGRLTLPEIATLELDADLVVLSACETAVGTPRGDEVLGLVRTFLHAGSRSLVASLWSVGDASTAEWMAEFYRALVREHDVAAALRAATVELRRTHPHPYHWAPFVAVGAWGSAAV